MKYEWKKQEKEFYGAKKSPSLVTVPAQNYIMISGKGNPNDIDFSNRVSALYSLAYAIKMAYKATAIQNEFDDFTVFPLEGIWQKIEETELVKENLEYTIMIRQPDFMCEDMVNVALERVNPILYLTKLALAQCRTEIVWRYCISAHLMMSLFLLRKWSNLCYLII